MIGLAKNVFAVHDVDKNGNAVLVKLKVALIVLSELIAILPPCVIGIEACSAARYWARIFKQYGHDVNSFYHTRWQVKLVKMTQLMSWQFVKQSD